MKTKLRLIIVSLVAIFALVGAWLLIEYYPETVVEELDETEEDTEEDEAETIYITDYEVNTISSIYINSPVDEFTIDLTVTIEEETDDDGVVTEMEYYECTLNGYENYTVTSNLGYAFYELVGMESLRYIEEYDNLEDFGIGTDDTVEVTINFLDGTEQTMLIGTVAASTSGNYVYINDELHIVSVNDIISSEKSDYVNGYYYNTITYDADTGDQNEDDLEYIEFSGANFDVTYRVEDFNDSYGHRIVSPIYGAYAEFTTIEYVALALAEFGSIDIAVLNATELDLAETGMDEPYVTISYQINGEEHTISVGEEILDGNCRYMIAEGDTSTIYYVDADYVSYWADLNPLTLRTSIVYMPAINTLSSFSVVTDDYDLDFQIERTVNEETSTDTVTYYNYTATLNGVEVEYGDHINDFYLSMIAMALLNLDEEEDYESSASLTITYNYREGGTDVLEYYENDIGRYQAYLNGEYTATIRESTMTTFFGVIEEYVEWVGLE